MAKTHERGRLTDDEYATYAPQTLTFDRKEATFTEKQCLEWVKTMAPKPEPEAPPDMDDADGEGDGAFAGKRLRRLFTHATRRTAAPAATPDAREGAGAEDVGREARLRPKARGDQKVAAVSRRRRVAPGTMVVIF